MSASEEIPNHPNIFDHTTQLTARLSEATQEFGMPIVAAPKATDLGLRLIETLAAQQERPNYALIVDEMRALGVLESIPINDRYQYVVGCSMALDPHTYLRADAQEVIQQFRKTHGVGSETPGTTANGLPAHIQPSRDKAPIQLPLHFVTWCFVEDTTQTDVVERYKAVDALAFFTEPTRALSELSDIDKDNLDKATQQANLRVIELTLRNKAVIAEIYNDVLLGPITDAIITFMNENPGSIHIPPEVSDVRQYIIDTLQLDPQYQRGYCNIGHSPKDEQKKFDGGRGPATLKPRHDFTRFVPMDRFALLVGKSRSADLTSEEYDTYERLLTAVITIFPEGQRTIPIQHKPLAALAQEELSLFVKSLDTLSDYLATHTLPVLAKILRANVPNELGASIIRAEHIASATTIAAEHGKSMQIKIPDTLFEGEDDAAFGARIMGELFVPIQKFLTSYQQAYQEVYALATQQRLTQDNVLPIINRHLTQYSEVTEKEKSALARALAQLKPTAKAQESWQKPLENDTERTNAIQKLKLILELLTHLVNAPKLQKDLMSQIHLKIVTDARSLQDFFTTRNISYKGEILPESTWQDVWRDLQQTCFNETQAPLQTKIYARMATAVYGLERRGERIGPRSENMPAVPGMLLSYRVLKDPANPQSRVLECELGIASGQRGSFEIVTGALLRRIADLMTIESA